ncbi:MAG: RpiB/LacA/LacB family sugar-phosphate isomerase [Patescibacteria group bacterium]
MKIYLASDHAGFKLKEALKKFLTGPGYEIEDCGAFSLDPEDDYPTFVRLAAKAVADDPDRRKAIIIGGSGQGEAMVANRYHGVRAAVFYGGPIDIIKLSREHNDANVLSLGARFLPEFEALKVVELWLKTPFSKEKRHQRRIDSF